MKDIIILFLCATICADVSANFGEVLTQVGSNDFDQTIFTLGWGLLTTLHRVYCFAHMVLDLNGAPFITPCHASDVACLKSSAQTAVPIVAAGVPSLGMEKMDPMWLDHVQASQAGLNMDFRDTVVKGLRNCEVLSLRRSTKKTDLELKCSVILHGDYTLSGKLLILPIEGNGKYRIKIRDIVVKIAFEVDEKRINGDEYWTLGNWKHSADVLTNVDFRFQNLFNGDKKLSDTVQEFANSNWRDIFHEVAPPIVKAVVSQVVSQIKKLFDQVPVKQLDLDTNEW